MAMMSAMAGNAMTWLGGSTGAFSNLGTVSAGMKIGGSIGNFIQQRREAKLMRQAQEQQWQAQLANTREQYRQLGQQEAEANKEFHQSLIQNQISLMQQQAQVELLAGATGTGGGSVTSMLNDLAGQAGRNQAQIVSNFENQQKGFINQARAIQTGGQMQMRTFNKPSALNALTSGLSGAASSYLQGAEVGKELGKAWDDSRSFTSSGVGV